MADEGEYVSPTEATELVRPRHGATSIREFADAGLLRVTYTAGGHRRIERASIDELNTWLAMRPGPEKQAAREELIRRNLGTG
ncbi:hypothetical protein OOJ91_12455 [Micromonospora lupini]|uniref:hypothetical protein n=1 Tax=Micromonospora lupini TaxID=285679 RepID=UPI00224F07B9|nr:hypothetical protein [Micromonospora lupini]MCX5066691.1 hypothetical protein [Micromonospora lupini]